MISNLKNFDQNHIVHPYAMPEDSKLFCHAAYDEFLELAEHGKVIDAISSWWTIQFGHRDKYLIEALTKAAQTLDHVIFANITHEPAIKLAELLLSFAPWQGGGKVFYSDNGSTAMEVALKISHQFWRETENEKRDCFLAFDGGYHGDTIGTMSLARDQIFFRGWEGLLFNCKILPLNLEDVEKTLKKEKGKISAIVIEPLIQGAGGMLIHDQSFLKGLEKLSQENSVHLILDEVMTGGGRTGEYFAGNMIKADIIATSKTLAGGLLPLAATLISDKIFQPWQDKNLRFYHGHSFAGHPLACGVAVANLQRFKNLPELPALRINKIWHERVKNSDLSNYKRVSIVGSVLAIELNGLEYGATIGKAIAAHALQRGVLLRPLGDVVYTLPPFYSTDDSLHKIFDVMLESIEFAK